MSKRKKPDDTRELCDAVAIAPGVRMRAAGAPRKGRKVATDAEGYAIVRRELIELPKVVTARPLPPCPYGEV